MFDLSPSQRLYPLPRITFVLFLLFLLFTLWNKHIEYIYLGFSHVYIYNNNVICVCLFLSCCALSVFYFQINHHCFSWLLLINIHKDGRVLNFVSVLYECFVWFLAAWKIYISWYQKIRIFCLCVFVCIIYKWYFLLGMVKTRTTEKKIIVVDRIKWTKLALNQTCRKGALDGILLRFDCVQF